MADWPDLLPEQGTDPALALAVDAVRGYCGWHIAPSITETVRVSGNGTRDLLVQTLMLTEVGEVLDDDRPVEVSEWEEYGLLRKPRGWWSPKLRGVTVTFTHGYDTCPGDLEGAIRSLAARGVTSTGLTSASLGAARMSYGAGGADGALGATPAEEKVLRRYRIGNLA